MQLEWVEALAYFCSHMHVDYRVIPVQGTNVSLARANDS